MNKFAISPRAFANIMERLHDSLAHDTETQHYVMDQIICEVLIDLGYEEGVRIFKDTKKWYA